MLLEVIFLLDVFLLVVIIFFLLGPVEVIGTVELDMGFPFLADAVT